MGSFYTKIIKFKNRYFTAATTSQSTYVAYSDDLQTWTTNYDVKLSYQGCVATEDRLTFYCQYSSKVINAYSTTDGINFETKQINVSGVTTSSLKNFYSALYANGYVWIIGDNDNGFKYNYKSVDGWTSFEQIGAESTSLNGGNNTRLEYTNGKYITMYEVNYAKIYESADFINWESHNILVGTTSFSINDFACNEVANNG